MKTQLLVRRIREAAAVRPAGYVEDVLSKGTIILVDGIEVLELPYEELEKLRAKYDGGPPVPSYEPPAASYAMNPGRGPGTELSKLLKRFGIEPTPTCSCRAKAAQMDAWGPDECSKPERIDEVVAVMRAEAAARGLPFLDLPARLLVKRAMSNARKAEASRAREAEGSPLHPER